ncbi:Protein get1 [Glarea lozoyensis ATCC 20868]|uniref:Protein get1 n=1 Tax=Glarea lozoyensis (strain ATCC 20868 / MF5171) TaxID=1116229 RepID=S3DI63_GLAL2|nr:Protein get1 [Glarea lozoyensis ATCC 20868]EPE36819.1 Protein get1 [Glarea lozoyensis ATCC 20868]
MPSLLVIVFVLQLTIHLVNTFGVETINNVLWHLYNMLPVPTSQSANKLRVLKKEYNTVRMQMNATSSQDEFAKWAKLRRKSDKLGEEIEGCKNTLDSTRANFNKIVGGLRWLGLNGFRMLLQFWFQKQPMFWIPQGWAPYYAEWLLSFPRAPVGSVSVQSWSIACLAVIQLVSDAVVAAVALAATPRSAGVKQREAMKVPGEKTTPAQEGKAPEKKEL